MYTCTYIYTSVHIFTFTLHTQLTFKARRIYVGNLPQQPAIDDKQLREFFDQVLREKRWRLSHRPTNRQTDRPTDRQTVVCVV